MSRTALIDADIVAYKVAFVNEEGFDWEGDGNTVYAVEPDEAKEFADDLINEYADKVKASRVIVCLTEPDPAKEWRRQFDPTYKANRKGLRKPELLEFVKLYLANEWPSYIRPRLEADDIMGILQTHPRLIEGETVIVSADKDMRTIPGRLYNPNKDRGVERISTLNANRMLCWQTIVGDQTDGYPGAPRVGPLSDYARALETITDPHELWYTVVEAFDSVGLTEDDALHQARLAHILRASSYNFKKKKVRLWTPVHLLINFD